MLMKTKTKLKMMNTRSGSMNGVMHGMVLGRHNAHLPRGASQCRAQGNRNQVVVRAGRGFGKKSKVETEVKQEETAQVEQETQNIESLMASKAKPKANNKGETWVREVLSSEDFQKPRPPAAAPGPATIPVESYEKIEKNFLIALGVSFGLIFVEGLVLAGSGFLPENVDQFIVNYIYPCFTPTLGVSLLFSVAYGLFKGKVEPR